MSNRFPLYRTVREIPPTYSASASRTVDVSPARESAHAAVSPAGPAPMMRCLRTMASPPGYPMPGAIVTDPDKIL
jgi:hypothetical protein